MDAISLALFANRITAVCDEMGVVLQRAAFSPNIRDRLDFSCAIFDRQGQLCAQAAHIPVHLGSMAYAMAGLVSAMEWSEGDMVVLNDPFQGGTHLPDVTLIAPVFVDGQLSAFVANRAHHADIGAHSPGSMPISTTLEQEGLLIPPTYLMRAGRLELEFFTQITGVAHNRQAFSGDFQAQISANRTGTARLSTLITQMGRQEFFVGLKALNLYGERLAKVALSAIPEGKYTFQDVMDDDGQGHEDIVISATLTVGEGQVYVDFTGTAGQVAGNINCPLSVAAAAVFYVFRCLMPSQTPACAGSFRPISLSAPPGCLVNALPPAAVAAGNVETSSRIVDVIMGALAQAMPERMCAASQGSMNNLAMGGRDKQGSWDYYETMGGGMGAGPEFPGLSAVQTHMTNTLNTPIEILELNYPLRLHQYKIRRGSGGAGFRPGGDGLIREFEFLRPSALTLLTERRIRSPWGLQGGHPGSVGENRLNNRLLPAKVEMRVASGDRLLVVTPGGGGWGTPEH